MHWDRLIKNHYFIKFIYFDLGTTWNSVVGVRLSMSVRVLEHYPYVLEVHIQVNDLFIALHSLMLLSIKTSAIPLDFDLCSVPIFLPIITDMAMPSWILRG